MNRKILSALGVVVILALSVYGYIESTALASGSGQPSPLTFPGLNFTPSENRSSVPAISPIGNRTVDQGTLLSFQVNATDPGGRGLSYYASTLPPGAAFDPGTRTFGWTPTDSQAGTFGVVFTVFNGITIAQERVSITVRPPSGAAVPGRRTELSSLIDSWSSLPGIRNGAPAQYNTSRTYTVDSTQSIQSVIDRASDGDVIIVDPGTYRENLNVHRSIILLGRDRPVLDAGGAGSALSLTIGGAVVDGFIINHSGSGLYNSGIKVSSNRNIIRNNTITGNQYGIYFVPPSSHNEVFHNNIYNNSLDGIFGTNMHEDTVIASNQVLANGQAGVRIDLSSFLTITGNTIGFNGENGIILNRSISNLVQGNTVQNNGYEGIYLRSGGRNLFTGNILRNNLESGIMIADSLDPDLRANQITPWTSSDFLNTVKENSFFYNHGPGLFLDGVTALVDGNSFQDNQFGIKITDSIASITLNTAKGNSLGLFLLNTGNSSISQNILSGNEIGIFVQGLSGDNLIEQNTAGNNSISGILLEPETRLNVVRENTATNNTDIGLGNYGQNYLMNNLVVFNGRNEVSTIS